MTTTNLPTKYCQSCGTIIDIAAPVCPHCGSRLPAPPGFYESEKTILPAFLLAMFLGPFGAHRFYVGKIGTAILQIVTLGGLGIWVLIDIIFIVTGNFKDKQGQKLVDWT